MESYQVLLIDDEEAFVTTLAERLELRGITARIALDGQTGLDVIAAQQPEIVVLDLRMPGIGGIEVLRQIRHQWPQLPVIMLSGHGSGHERDICLEMGACVYHNKPLDIDMLLQSIQTARLSTTAASAGA